MDTTRTDLSLEPLERRHLPLIVQWRADDVVRQHVREVRLLSEGDIEAWYDGLRGDATRSYMILANGLEIVGIGGFTSINHAHQRAELTVLVDDLTLEVDAIEVLCAYGFDRLNLHRIDAETWTHQRTESFKAAGFTVEGGLRDAYRRDGDWRRAVLLGLIADD